MGRRVAVQVRDVCAALLSLTQAKCHGAREYIRVTLPLLVRGCVDLFAWHY
jgi:hypothetical protein